MRRLRHVVLVWIAIFSLSFDTASACWRTRSYCGCQPVYYSSCDSCCTSASGVYDADPADRSRAAIHGIPFDDRETNDRPDFADAADARYADTAAGRWRSPVASGASSVDDSVNSAECDQGPDG